MFSNESKVTGILLDGDDDEEDLIENQENEDNDDNVEETTPTIVEDPFITCIESLEETVITSLVSRFIIFPFIKN